MDKEQASEKKITASASGRRYGRSGRRRGRHGYAAPIGVLVTVLSLIGAAALIWAGVAAIRRATDTTALKEEFYYFLEPVMVYNPTPFDDIETTEQDAFLSAAAYKVVRAEQIRMLRENDENCLYAVDDSGRIVVPLAEIETAYRSLFGPSAPMTNRTLSDDGLAFSAADNCYYVPFESLNIGYRSVVDTVKHRGSTYTVRVGYVANNDIKLDEHGNEMVPTADMATYYQTYTLVKNDGGYYLSACADN